MRCKQRWMLYLANKQHQYLHSRPPANSKNYHKYILNFYSPRLANWQWLLNRPIIVHNSQILVHRWALRTVADPYLQIRRGPDHPVPEMGGEGGCRLGPEAPPPPWIRHCRTRFLALFCGQTKQGFSSTCGAGYFLVAYIPYKNLPQ